MTQISNPPPGSGNVATPQTVVHTEPPQGSAGFIKRLIGFFGWIFTGFGLLNFIHRRNDGHTQSEEIIVYTVHQSFYLWALILIGFIGSFWVKHWTAGPESSGAVLWGWIYIFVLMYTIVTLLYDVSTFKALLWGGVFLLLWITSKYLETVDKWTVLSGVGRYLSGLKPELNPGTASVVSWMLVVPWIGSLFQSFSRGRKVFAPNSIEEWFLGEGHEVMDRSGLKFRTHYRDIFEMILGMGAGDIEAIDSSQHIVKRWENVLFLWFAWKKLDEILHQRAATVDNAPQEPVEVEEVKRQA